jgi:hypothetical protein
MSAPRLAATYQDARLAFVAAAAAAGAATTSWTHPLTGPAGEELAVDVASLGPADADDVVVVVSATHGVEGYCGSALQTAWLQALDPAPPPATRVVLVHALNPYGFAWVRRVNEDNVDLNRNFVDWSKPPPEKPDYSSIAELLVPTTWDADTQASTGAALMDLALRWGPAKIQEAVSGGQYEHPTGVFYGGTGPVWSHRWLRAWAAEELAAAARVSILDLHTGLGPWGFGELIGSAPGDSAEHRRACAMWGDVRSMLDGSSVSAVLDGDWLAVDSELAPQAEVTAVAIEYGTVDQLTVLQALRADAWLHAHGDPTGPDAPAIRSQVRAAFADDDPAWIAACRARFDEVLALTFASMA